MNGSEHAEAWVAARDAAVLTLLYGCGLRISEALNLNRCDAPVPPNDDVLRITGKGGKVRLVPVLPAGGEGNRDLHRARPRTGAITAPCSSASAVAG
jgi:integrase/recombinase XerC